MAPGQARLSSSPKDRVRRRAVEALLEGWANRWNRHDADGLAALVAQDVDFVTVAGRWLQGRSDFREWHSSIHRAHLRDSLWTNRGHRLRLLRDDLLLVHLEWTIANERVVGQGQRERSGIFTWLVAPGDEAWCILAAHNTNLAEASRHCLSGPVERCH
jgi:uncharacterized protein (TIGR02246 family)